MDNLKVLEGEDVLFIKRTNIVRDYKSEDSSFKGKQYRVYAFGDKAFAVHEDDEFHADLKDGAVAKVMLTVTDDGWSLVKHITWKQLINLKGNSLTLDSLTIENVRAKANTLQPFAELS